jgi:hypothetical protein
MAFTDRQHRVLSHRNEQLARLAALRPDGRAGLGRRGGWLAVAARRRTDFYRYGVSL